MKNCTKCRKRKKTDAFYKNKHSKDGLQNMCKKCALAYRNKQNKKHRDQGVMTHSQRTRQRLRLEVLTHYSPDGPECSCCKENLIEFLAIDHINGGGNAHRKKIGASGLYTWLKKHNFPKGYRVLCHNCNQSIGTLGYCPHQKCGPRDVPVKVRWRETDAINAIKKTLKKMKKEKVKPTIYKVADASGVPRGTVGHLRKNLVKSGEW